MAELLVAYDARSLIGGVQLGEIAAVLLGMHSFMLEIKNYSVYVYLYKTSILVLDYPLLKTEIYFYFKYRCWF